MHGGSSTSRSTEPSRVPPRLRFFYSPTPKNLPAEIRLLFAHCVTITAERIVGAPESEVVKKWLSLWHLIPRLLVPQEALRRAGVGNYSRPAARRRPSSRRVRAPSPAEIAVDIYRRVGKYVGSGCVLCIIPVSYTHLTLPTILLV